MAHNLVAPMAIEAGEVPTPRQSAARRSDHGHRMARGLGRDRPMAVAAGPAIFPQRNSVACLVRAGYFGVGGVVAMVGTSGTGGRTGAGTGDGSRAGAAVIHERGRG